MKPKALIALIIVAILAVAGTSFVLKSNSSKWSKTIEEGKVMFDGLPVNDIAQINISKGDKTLHLERKNDVWVVKERNDYPANFADISDLAMKLTEIKPLRIVEAVQSQLGRLDLNPADSGDQAGTLLEMNKDGSNHILSLLLGKPYIKQSETQNAMMRGPVPEGRYLLVDGSLPVYLVGETFSNIEPDPTMWLNKDFIKVEKITSVSMQFMGENVKDWVFTREKPTDTFTLQDKKDTETVDESKIRSLSSIFGYASFEDVLPLDTPTETTRLNMPSVAEISTADGFTYTLNIGKKTADESGRYLNIKVDGKFQEQRVAPEGESEADKARLDKEFASNLESLQKKLAKEKECEGWIYVVSSWAFDNLLKNRADWMQEKKNAEPAATTEVAPEVPEAEEVPVMLERPAESAPPEPVLENVQETVEELYEEGEEIPENLDVVVEGNGEEEPQSPEEQPTGN